MAEPFRLPISPEQLNGIQSVSRTEVFGTNYSILGIGGFMEVFNLSDLEFTIPIGVTGLISSSANTIPIEFIKGDGSAFSPDVLTLASDNMSSGRRRLGMLVYVYETDQVYQYRIDNYDTLWAAATGATGVGGNTVVVSDFGSTVKNNSVEGQNFIDAWTANTIEDYAGSLRANSVWKKYYGTPLALIGGSFNSMTGTLNMSDILGFNVPISGFTSGGGGAITGGTFDSPTITLDLNSTGGTVSITGVTGIYITGGTYTSGTSTLNLFNSTGGTISITGITAGSGSGGTSNFQYFISGSTPTGTINDGDRWFYTESGEEFVWITDQDGSQWVQPVSISYGVSEEFVHITGDTMTGTLYLPTISATTYQNLPGSSSSNCFTTFYATNISGCSPVNMLTEVNMLSGLTVTGNGYFTGVVTATTISATTYSNLPTDIRTTGGTYSNNTFTFTNNTGGTYSVLFNTVTGLTINGNLTVTGTTSSPTFTGNSLTLSNSASTIYLDNTTAQQIKFYDGGRGTPSYNSYSAGAKIIFTDNISSISSGHAIGVDSGSLWYGSDLSGNGHDWYAGTNRLMSLISSTGLRLFGLGGPTTTAMVISGTSALGSKGGVGYMDFLQVVNNWSGATNPNKWFRTNPTGGLEILNNAYTATILTISDSGIMAVAGGNLATTSSNDAQTNYLTFGNNNTQIYDDGNTHIHSRSAGQSMWINTNGGQLNLLTQGTVSGGGIGSGIAIATGTLNGYVTINTGRTVTTDAAYGYLTTAGPGTYPGGSQSVSISLYANNRIWGQEIDAFSDERMKNIESEISLEEGIKLVNNLKPIKYTWKEGEDKGLKAGYSAQQVIKSGFDHLISIIPTEGLDETVDEDGFTSPKDTQFSMNYDQVTPYHGVVIKHLLEEIENLKQEIKELKNKIK